MQDQDFLDALDSHLDRLHNLSRALTDSPHDAEDLLQETCLLALRGWRRRPPQDPGAWLATVCLNAARSRWRRRAARAVEVRADLWLHTVPDSSASTAEQALTAVTVEQVRAAVRQLPEHQRVAVTMMDLSGFTAAQTAEILQCPRGTVLARVHRARKVLAGLLSEQGVSPDGARPRR